MYQVRLRISTKVFNFHCISTCATFIDYDIKCDCFDPCTLGEEITFVRKRHLSTNQVCIKRLKRTHICTTKYVYKFQKVLLILLYHSSIFRMYSYTNPVIQKYKWPVMVFACWSNVVIEQYEVALPIVQTTGNMNIAFNKSVKSVIML